MAEAWRALVVGCGKVAGGYNQGAHDKMVLTHAAAYTRHDGFVLAGCVDPDKATRETFMRKWGVPAGYPTLEAAFASDRYDIASICSPTGTHVATAERLLEFGIRAIFLEKPVDGDPEGARRLAKKARARGIATVVNFTRRFDPSMRLLQKEIASGTLGALMSVVGWFGRGTLNNASHLIDLVIFLTGRKPKLISTGAKHCDLSRSDPSVAALLDLDGVALQIAAVDGQVYARFEIELAFERGIVAIEDGGLSIRRRSVNPSSDIAGVRMADRGIWTQTLYGEALLVALGEIREAAESGAASACDLEVAANSVEITLAIRDAALREEVHK